MAIKEKVKEFSGKAKRFWKEHWKEIFIVGGGVTLTGAIAYELHKSRSDAGDETPEAIYGAKEAARESIEDKTAWNKDWDAQALALEFATHQPLGPFREPGDDTDEDGYVDPLEGVSYIVAGPNSFYNDNPDTVEIYVLDNEGYYHHKPDDVCNA